MAANGRLSGRDPEKVNRQVGFLVSEKVVQTNGCGIMRGRPQGAAARILTLSLEHD